MKSDDPIGIPASMYISVHSVYPALNSLISVRAVFSTLASSPLTYGNEEMVRCFVVITHFLFLHRYSTESKHCQRRTASVLFKGGKSTKREFLFLGLDTFNEDHVYNSLVSLLRIWVFVNWHQKENTELLMFFWLSRFDFGNGAGHLDDDIRTGGKTL